MAESCAMGAARASRAAKRHGLGEAERWEWGPGESHSLGRGAQPLEGADVVQTGRLLSTLWRMNRLLVLVVLTGCGDDAAGTDAGTTAGRDSGGGGIDSGTTPGEDAGSFDSGTSLVTTMNVGIGPFTTPRGEERTICASFDLGNTSIAAVRAIRTHLTAGSHHMIVYALDEAPDPTPRPCGAFQHGMSDAIFIAEKPEAALVYPPGTGLTIAAHQTIGLELHHINYFSDTPVDIAGMVELDLIEPDAEMMQVQFLFTGDLALSIPARMTTTVSSFHSIGSGPRVFALTSHTHQLGTLATLHRGTSTSDLGEELHRSTNWAEPPLDTYDPALTFAPGEGLVLTCEFTNTTDRDVGFGTDFDDEMCFLWAHYY
jgi:hypothetical protein